MSDWISAWEALIKVQESEAPDAGATPSSETAASKILEALAGGQLRVHAHALIQDCDDGNVPDYHVKRARDVKLNPHQSGDESEFAIFDTPVPTDFFDAQQGWKITNLGWELGRILAVRPSNNLSADATETSRANTRRYVTGLKFLSADVDQIVQSTGNAPVALSALKSPKPGGKHVRLEVWEKFWFELIRMIEPTKLNKTRLKSQAHLRRTLLHRTDNCMSEEAMIDTVRNLWHAFVEPKKPRFPGDRT